MRVVRTAGGDVAVPGVRAAGAGGAADGLVSPKYLDLCTPILHHDLGKRLILTVLISGLPAKVNDGAGAAAWPLELFRAGAPGRSLCVIL